MSAFFKELYSKNATPEDFESLQDRVVLMLCRLEGIFLHAFFDIMVHLIVHLPYQAKVGGPVMYHWIYPIERYVSNFIYLFQNINSLWSYYISLIIVWIWENTNFRLGGSIVEVHVAEECAAFCVRYLQGTETRENKPPRNQHDGDEAYMGLSIFSPNWRASSKMKDICLDYSVIDQAHSYVLFNCDEVQVYAQ